MELVVVARESVERREGMEAPDRSVVRIVGCIPVEIIISIVSQYRSGLRTTQGKEQMSRRHKRPPKY